MFPLKRARRLNNTGQLVIILPISIAITVGGLAIWALMDSVNRQRINTRREKDLRAFVERVANRTKRVLAENGPAACSVTTGMPAGVPVNSSFIRYRNLSYSPIRAAPYNLDTVNYTYIPAALGGSPAGLENCLIYPTEDAGVQPLHDYVASIQITVNPIGQPDHASLTRPVAITVRAETLVNGAAGLAKKVVDHTITHPLQVPSLGKYSLVLRDQGGTSAPQLNIGASANLYVMGPAFHAGKSATTLTLANLMSLTGVTVPSNIRFYDVFDVRADSITMSASTNTSNLQTVFRDGIVTRRMSAATSTPFLPIEDDGPNGKAWDQPMDYRFMEADNIAIPLPDLSSELTGGGPTAYAFAGRYPMYPATFRSSCLGGSCPGTSHTIPAASAIANGNWQTIGTEFTCGDNNRPRTFVFMRKDDDLTIDFAAGSFTGRAVLCGLVMANSVTVNLNAGNATIFGSLVTRRLTVTGSGTLYLVSPNYDKALPSGSIVPRSKFDSARVITQSEISQQFGGVSASFGRNFFVPVFSKIPSAPALWPWRPYGSISPYCVDNVMTVRPDDARPYECSQYDTTTSDQIGFLFRCNRQLNYYCVHSYVKPQTDIFVLFPP